MIFIRRLSWMGEDKVQNGHLGGRKGEWVREV